MVGFFLDDNLGLESFFLGGVILLDSTPGGWISMDFGMRFWFWRVFCLERFLSEKST